MRSQRNQRDLLSPARDSGHFSLGAVCGVVGPAFASCGGRPVVKTLPVYSHFFYAVSDRCDLSGRKRNDSFSKDDVSLGDLAVDSKIDRRSRAGGRDIEANRNRSRRSN